MRKKGVWLASAAVVVLASLTYFVASAGNSAPAPAGARDQAPAVPLQPRAAKTVPGADTAHVLALTDLTKGVKPFDQPFIRYLWIPGSADVPVNIKATSFGLHWLSNSPVPHRPPVLGGGKKDDGSHDMALIRVDLRMYATNTDDLDRWIRTWDKLTFDPNFSLLIEFDTIKLIAESGGRIPEQITAIGDKTMQVNGKNVTVLRLPAPYLDLNVLFQLEQLTGSVAPVVHFEYFLMRGLSSIKDNLLFEDVFGGLYYDFANVRTAKQAGKKKATDLDVLFQDLGIIDDADGEVNAQVKLDKLGSEQRTAMLHSLVTGKPRSCHILPTLKSVRRRGVVLLTYDVKDSSINLLKNVFANLLDFKPDALEVIWVDANGSQKYALYNDKFALQNEVPPDVANDTTIPSPYTKRLHAMSCIICHGQGDADGWQPMPNEVRQRKARFDLIADVSNRNKTLAETLNLLASKYGGNVDGLLMDLRRDTIAVTMQATGSWPNDRDQTGTYRLAAGRIEALRNGYWYTQVNAEIALREVWVDPGTEKPLEVLTKLLPPDILSRNDVLGIIPEDIRIGDLLDGKAIPRAHWELVKGFVANRVRQTFKILKEKNK